MSDSCIQSALQQILARQDLGSDLMTAVMQALMAGEVEDAQIGALLTGLRMKGETVEEISAAARVMRSLSSTVSTAVSPLIDTCGTGGDGLHTFNISTASAFVVAAAGGYVAKHGNRSVSSNTGSADVLECLGINIELSPDQVRTCIEQTGIGFMFAPRHHGSMKHVAAARRALRIRTLFNLLGPLTNPAGAKFQVLGVYDSAWLEPMAQVVSDLGIERALIVHAQDGLDEVSICAPTSVVESCNGSLQQYIIDPRDFGMSLSRMEDITVTSAQQSADVIRWVFAGQRGAAFDIVCLNAAAALYCARLCPDLSSAIELARDSILCGAAAEKVALLLNKSHEFKSANSE